MAGGGPQTRGAAAAGLLCVLALSPVDSVAQRGKPKVPPQLPPQASEQAQQKVAEHTAPTVSLIAPAAGALYTAPAAVLLEASAIASSGGRSIAKVEFFAGTTLIGTATEPPYQFNWGNAAAGSYSLTARATDNLGMASTSAPVAIIVNAPPTVSLAAPANNALFTAPAVITLTADAADSDGGIAQVEFFQGTALVATVTSAPFTAGLSNVTAGSYTYSARATDDRGAVASSASVSVQVNAPPSITLTSPAADASFTAPATVPLSAQALDSDGTIARVEFYDGANLIGTLTEPPFNTNWLLVPAGSYSLTARVSDNLGATAVSEAVSVTVTQALAQIYYVHTDHLNTPRAIYDQQQRLVWRWDNEDPFGGNLPNENPSGLGNFTCDLRLPGQYFDRETNTHYNYFRDYDPAIGRYVQSDPIGLRGGINTYAYVLSNPLSRFDLLGLETLACIKPLNFLGGFAAGTSKSFDGYIPDVVNPLFHQYLCVGKDGRYKCGGQDTTGGPVASGKPSDDFYPYNRPDLCVQVENDKCIEGCVLRKINEPKRPNYILLFSDCQRWVKEVLQDCRGECRSLK